MTYTAPIRHINHVLEDIVEFQNVLGTDKFRHVDQDLAKGIIAEAARYLEEEVAPINKRCDEIGAQFRDGSVTMPPQLKQAWQGYAELGFQGFATSEDFGGLGLPHSLFSAVQEMTAAAGLSFVQTPMLSICAMEAIEHHADDATKQLVLPRMASGEWTGTMNLTEAHAGSDLGVLRSSARRLDNGRYAVRGQKIFITGGDHDLAENIIHLVLARLEDAPDGPRGLSLFLVPKYRIEADGNLGERNDVNCVSIEEKMGLHASATCTMAFGDDEDCEGILIGEENKGLACMFTMMNAARLHVGLQAIGCAERAFQMALAYATERVQGAPVGCTANPKPPIFEHADVRRMLMTMRARTAAARAICYYNAMALDMATAAEGADERRRWRQISDVVTPLSKAYGTETGVLVASDAMQVFGGMGFVEETGIAQIYRDVRITPIYEGTNGIQAWDLANRKLKLDDYEAFDVVMDQLEEEIAGFSVRGVIPGAVGIARAAAKEVRQTAGWLRSQHADGMARDAAAGATPFLILVAECVGAWLMLKGAHKAQAKLDAGQGDAEFLNGQIAITRFYCERLLPQSIALGSVVRTGDRLVSATTKDALAA